MSLGHVFAKLLSIRSQVNVWHQTVRTHNACHTSLQLLEQGPQLVLGQLVLLACHSGHLPNTQNACDEPRRDGICGSWQCLVLVGWAGTFVCRLDYWFTYLELILTRGGLVNACSFNKIAFSLNLTQFKPTSNGFKEEKSVLPFSV